jgi:hypothetical protein
VETAQQVGQQRECYDYIIHDVSLAALNLWICSPPNS